MINIKKITLIQLVVAGLLSTQLSACFPVVAGGAAAGGLMAADRRTSGAYVEDQSIEIKASQSLAKELGDNLHSNVTSFNRNVLITGEAFNDESKTKAEALVKNVANVRSVTNELAIAPSSSLSSRSSDAYITSKVKTRMISDNHFPSNYVKVVTERSNVYLMGIVTHKEADDAVAIARGTGGVDKVVKVFEYLD